MLLCLLEDSSKPTSDAFYIVDRLGDVDHLFRYYEISAMVMNSVSLPIYVHAWKGKKTNTVELRFREPLISQFSR